MSDTSQIKEQIRAELEPLLQKNKSECRIEDLSKESLEDFLDKTKQDSQELQDLLLRSKREEKAIKLAKADTVQKISNWIRYHVRSNCTLDEIADDIEKQFMVSEFF